MGVYHTGERTGAPPTGFYGGVPSWSPRRNRKRLRCRHCCCGSFRQLGLRERSFLEPKKEPKKAAFVATAVAGFSANWVLRRSPFPGSTAPPCARCAKRTAEQREKSGKMNELIFRISLFVLFARELAWRPCAKLAEASLFFHPTRFAGCFFVPFFRKKGTYSPFTSPSGSTRR